MFFTLIKIRTALTQSLYLCLQPIPLIRMANRVTSLSPHHLPALPSTLRSRIVCSRSIVVQMFSHLLGGNIQGTTEDQSGWRTLVGAIWSVNSRSFLTRESSHHVYSRLGHSTMNLTKRLQPQSSFSPSSRPFLHLPRLSSSPVSSPRSRASQPLPLSKRIHTAPMLPR